MSDDVININIEDIAHILPTYDIFKLLAFWYFTVLYNLNSTEIITFTCFVDDCCIYHVR